MDHMGWREQLKFALILKTAVQSADYADFHSVISEGCVTQKMSPLKMVILCLFCGNLRNLRTTAFCRLMHNVQDAHWLPWFRHGNQHNSSLQWRHIKFKHALRQVYNFPPDITLSVEDLVAIVISYERSGMPLPIPLTHRNLAATEEEL